MAPVARLLPGNAPTANPTWRSAAPQQSAWPGCTLRDRPAAPLETSRLVHLALDIPEHFFAAVAEDELLPICRLVLEGRLPIEAWDLDALFVAVDRARLPVRVPFDCLTT